VSGAKRQGEALVWLRETVRVRGAAGAIRHYAMGAFSLLRDLTPGRRRSRYGDIDYDFDHGVDTTWATVTLKTRVRELLSGGQYQPSEPELFRRILHALPDNPDGFTFIDLGSGKGRTLLLASEFAFRRIIGVELLAELDAVAQQNVARFRSDEQKCFNVECYAGDARNFAFPAEPLVLYLFNPFLEHVLRTVLANLRESLKSLPRPAYVIYHNLIHERVFAECAWLRAVYRTTQYAIYRAA
jgi:SAM-dependent methyltransferase